MRFPVETFILSVIIAGGGGSPSGAVPGGSPHPGALSASAAAGSPITADEIRAAEAKLAADPNLGHDEKIRTLRATQTRPHDRAKGSPAPSWITGLFDYLGQTGSLLLWAAGAIAAAISLIWVYRVLKARTAMPEPVPVPKATRIGEMDIRPESLPDDIGAAALALADGGRTREALSLLYRGALSRAVHRFGVPIGESQTEDEALRAIGARLDAPRVSYVADLVALWRRVVYAGRPVAGDPIRRLCRGFAAALDSGRA